MAGVWNSCRLRCGVYVGLLFLVSVSGCKNAPQASATQQANSASRLQSGAAPTDGGDARPGRRRSRRGRADQSAAPGAFDFYLLNLSGSPEFCSTHGDSPECGRGLGFVVHGMWPQDVNGDYPEACSDAVGPSNPQTYTDIIPTASLVEHEWQTHGTCSGMAPEDYFAAIRKAFAGLKIPANIGAGSDAGGVAPDELIARFASANPGYPQGSIALSCGNNRLTAIEVCLTRDLQPESCQSVRSCRANMVKVTPR
jgi:ribonuclease T2